MGRNSIGDSAVQFSFKDEQQKVAKRSKNPLVGTLKAWCLDKQQYKSL
jgi:hypothetical protein